MTRPALLTPSQTTEIAVDIVLRLLGERSATKMQVEILPGGTCRVQAETGEAPAKAVHQWRAK